MSRKAAFQSRSDSERGVLPPAGGNSIAELWHFLPKILLGELQ